MAYHVVLGVRDYDFIDEKGQRRSGIKVFYLDEKDDGAHSRGYLPLVLTAAHEFLSSFPVVPGVYDLEFKQKPDRRTGRVVISLRSARYVSEFDIPDLEDIVS